MLVCVVAGLLLAGSCRQGLLPSPQPDLLVPGLTLPPRAKVTAKTVGEYETSGHSSMPMPNGKYKWVSLEFTSELEWNEVYDHISGCLAKAGYVGVGNSTSGYGSSDPQDAWTERYKFFERAGSNDKVNLNEMPASNTNNPASGLYLYALSVAVEQ